jgi:hypothetical protein
VSRRDTDTADDGADERGWSALLLQLGAVAGGGLLAGSYAMPWVDVTGTTLSAGSPASISAQELELLPELVAALGLLVFILAALHWATRTQAVVLAVGMASTAATLYGWFFVNSDASAVQLGGHSGPPSSFEPGVGLVVALAGSVVLVAAGFVALLRTLPDND